LTSTETDIFYVVLGITVVDERNRIVYENNCHEEREVFGLMEEGKKIAGMTG